MAIEDIEKAIEKAIEEDMAREATGLPIPMEATVIAYEVSQKFAEYAIAVEGPRQSKAMDALICTLIDMTVFGIRDVDIERMRKVKSGWCTLRDWLTEGEEDDGSEEHAE